jgi:hypothetical protein
MTDLVTVFWNHIERLSMVNYWMGDHRERMGDDIPSVHPSTHLVKLCCRMLQNCKPNRLSNVREQV